MGCKTISNLIVDLRVTGKEPNGSWRLQGQGVHGEVIAPESCLQAVAPPPVRKERKTAAEVAKGAAKEWLQGTLEEASGIAATLEQSAQTLREGLEPKASSEALREAYREAKRNFTDVAELRGALEAMGKGKTGRSMAFEQLLHLEDRELEPWLLITKMFFAGEVVDITQQSLEARNSCIAIHTCGFSSTYILPLVYICLKPFWITCVVLFFDRRASCSSSAFRSASCVLVCAF